MQFQPVIGLEIHAQLATNSKLFCSCSTEFGLPANRNTCPVCLGLPGVLPVLNAKVVEFAVRLGVATGCSIRLDSQFARKNYFYPDLPKSYQISQFDRPICENGSVDIIVNGEHKRIGITRIHIEEDAGKLVHDGRDPNSTYVDLNRAGVPLVEIVSEPDLRTPEEARLYMEKIHSLVTYLGVSNGDMEKGNLRADANISLRLSENDPFGTRTETKNINSFRYVQAALEYEIERQAEELTEGRVIHQETRLYDPLSKTTFSMRSKEEAHDYRYFPEPDLPVVYLEQSYVDGIRDSLPELPDDKLARYVSEMELSEYDAAILVSDRATAEFFETVVTAGAAPKRAANWISVELAARFNDEKTSVSEIKFTAEQLAAMIAMIDKGEISSKIAKTVFEEMYQTGKSPAEIVQEKGLAQVSDVGELEKIVDEIVAANQDQVEQFRSGKDKVFGFFVGQVMKATKGQANPGVVNDLLKKKLA